MNTESFKLLIISSMYEGSLTNFYNLNPKTSGYLYPDHYNSLMSGSTEFVASYLKNFRRLGIDATAIIANDKVLQNKWIDYYGYGNQSGDLLNQQILYYKPDVLWIEDLRFADIALLSEIKKNVDIRLLVAYHCAPWDDESLKKLRYFDFVITCTPGLKDQFENAGLKSYLVYHGFDNDFHEDLLTETRSLEDVVFSGSLKQGEGYHGSRIDLIKYLLSSGVKLSIYANIEPRIKIIAKKILRLFYIFLCRGGIKEPESLIHFLKYGKVPVNTYPVSIMSRLKKPVFGLEMYQLLKNSRIVLNNHGEVAANYAGNMRLFEATGVGSCLLTDDKSNLSDLFEVGKEAVAYENPQDCAQKIKWLLENEEEREKIAAAGRQRTLQSHTVNDRTRRIIEIIEKELSLKNAWLKGNS